MRSTDALTMGFTKCTKNPTTRPMMQNANTSMINTSLAKTDRWTRGVASVIAAPDEPIAVATDGLDEGRVPRVVAELLPQARDEDVDRTVERFPVEAARGFHDPVAGEGRSRVADKQ